jgi:hypothetical protein
MSTRAAPARATLALGLIAALSLAACGGGGSGGDGGGGGTSPAETSAAEEPTEAAGNEPTEPAGNDDGGSGGGGGDIPTISTRSFTGGSAKVTVRGFFDVDSDVAINTGASYADGGYTWLQYGVSGSEAPNALITVGDGEIGVSAGLGSYSAIVTSTECPGEIDVTDTTVSGHFSCTGVAGYNSGDETMGTVDLEVTFTADS